MVNDFPDHPEYLQGLSNVLLGLGALAARRGDWEPCLAFYGEALALRRKLATDHPTVIEYQGLLATAHNDLGRAYHFLKRYRDSEKEYRAAIRINTDLARRYPTIVTWRHSLVLNLYNLGTAYGTAGNLDRAEEMSRAALDEVTTLERDFEPLPAYRELRSSIFNNLGAVYGRKGRRHLGEASYREAVVITTKLHDEYPRNVAFAVSLGLNYKNMGDTTRNRTQPDLALGWYTKAIWQLKTTLWVQPQNRKAQGRLAESHAARAQLFAEFDRHKEAVLDWRSAQAHAPEEMRLWLEVGLALSLAHLGDRVRAAELAATRVRQPDLDPRSAYDLARVYGLCSGLAAADETVPPAERRKLADDYAEEAVGLLTRVHRAGIFRSSANAARFLSEQDFAPLRGRGDFQRLSEDIERVKLQPEDKNP